tara:strand:+ start:337 stop:1878 length:1542 start_codon:yes stop_codon:yes gene_type:complete
MANVPKTLINFRQAKSLADRGSKGEKFGWFLESIYDNFPYQNDFWADGGWSLNSRKPWKILTTSKNFEKLTKGRTKIGTTMRLAASKRARGFMRESRLVDVPYTTSGAQLMFVNTGPTRTTPNVKQTAQNERGSAWVLRRALKDDIKYTGWQDIMNDPLVYQLLDIYPDVDQSWLESYWRQNNKIHDEYSGSQWSEFNRDGGFMNFIGGLVKEKFNVALKDWNPADIWMIRGKSSKIEKMIEDEVGGSRGTQTIKELNILMRSLFASTGSEQVVGVSLKKVPGNREAHWVPFNMADMTFNERHDYNYRLHPKATFKVTTEGEPPHRKFVSQDAVIFLTAPKTGKRGKFQIKDNGGKSPGGNLKFEFSMPGESARAGKAPGGFYSKLMEDCEIEFENKWQKYPSTLERFNATRSRWEHEFNRVNREDWIITEVPPGRIGTDEFMRNLEEQYSMPDDAGEGPWLARSRLMQLDFLYTMLLGVGGRSKEECREFWTDMAFLGMKKGDIFGPFGKLS